MQILYIYFTTYTYNFVCKDVLNVDTKISKKWRFSDDSSGSLLSTFIWFQLGLIYVRSVFKEREIRLPVDNSTCILRCKKCIQKVCYQHKKASKNLRYVRSCYRFEKYSQKKCQCWKRTESLLKQENLRFQAMTQMWH